MQPQAGHSWVQVKAAGSAVVAPQPVVLNAVTCNQAFTGTVILYDNSSGTSSVEIANIANPGGAVTLDYNLSARRGIYHLSTGTPHITITYR